MAETKTTITDAELIEKIKTSHLEEIQKKELADLVSAMTTEERDELLSLIEESNNVDESAEKERLKKLAALNEEYEGKLKELTREESEYAREEFEKFDQKETASELKEVEAEIATNAKTEAEMTSAKNARTELGKAKKHTLRKIFFFLIFLALLTVGILYGLEYLNTL
jgi:hypothetical protein